MDIKTLDSVKRALVNEGVISEEQLRSAEASANNEKTGLLKVLVELEFLTEEELISFIGEKTHTPYVNLTDYTVDRAVLELIPEKIARRHKLIPLFQIENVLTVAMSDPLGIISIDDISAVARCPVEAVLASEESVNAAIDQWYGVGDSRKELIESLADEFRETTEPEEEESQYTKQYIETKLKKEASGASVIKLVNSYLAQAILEGASDIHLQPKRDFMETKFRIDGFLYDRGRLPADLMPLIISRVKILSGLDISKRRIPQDGRISLILRDRNIDVRTSIIPSLFGENIVLRILDKGKKIPTLPELGLSDQDLTTFNKLSKIPKGIILASGPTGSGKSTTIYSFVNALDKANKNIMTIEDPIEYEIDGIVQSNVDLTAGVTFAKALRAILRQDPDIIYVGEIRDEETAEVAVRSALTGHLVLSTLHTNDAVGTIMRLHEMGIKTPLIVSVLECAFAQRLVRKICPRCKKEYLPEEYFLRDLNLSWETTFYKGEGCKSCDGIGYRGMIGIFEVLTLDNNIKKMIVNNASEHEIKEAARKRGMKTMLEDGLIKARQGITTLDEVMRLTAEE